MMSRFSNEPAFSMTRASPVRDHSIPQKTGQLMDLFHSIERVKHDPPPLATPGNRWIPDRADIQPRRLQPLRSLPDRRITGDDHHLDRCLTVQPLIADRGLPEPAD